MKVCSAPIIVASITQNVKICHLQCSGNQPSKCQMFLADWCINDTNYSVLTIEVSAVSTQYLHIITYIYNSNDSGKNIALFL